MLIVNERARAPYLCVCESRGEFSGRSVLHTNYSEFTPVFTNVS